MKTKSWLPWVALAIGIWLLMGGGRQYPKGDVNGDGVVDIGDVTALKRIIEGLDPPNPRADVNGDGRIDQADIDEVKRIILGQP